MLKYCGTKLVYYRFLYETVGTVSNSYNTITKEYEPILNRSEKVTDWFGQNLILKSYPILQLGFRFSVMFVSTKFRKSQQIIY